MDISKFSKTELIDLCRQKNIKKYSGKTKAQLIELIQSEPTPTNDAFTNHENQEYSENKEYPKEKDEPYFATYLNSLKTKTGFKRVLSSPLRYPGGKTKAVGIILDILPKLNRKKIVSPFFGGGSVELCLSQSLGIQVDGYDVFSMLTNFWDVLIHRPTEFVAELSKFEINEPEFTRNRHILLHYWNKIKPESLVYNTRNLIELTEEEKGLLDNNSLMQAVYYYYNMTLSYGPMFLGWPSSHEIDPAKFRRRLENLKHTNLQNISVKCSDFEKVILENPDEFLFLDPPYHLGEDSKMFKGMYPNCNFAIHHNGFPHDRLCNLLKTHCGGFVLTYNDSPTIRQMYSEFKQIFPEWQYTYGQGETRIGKNRQQNQDQEQKNKNIKESHEIIIVCPPKYERF